MVVLRRVVRFCAEGGVPGVNGEAGSPPLAGLARHDEVEVTCEGEVGRETGYLVNIKEIDEVVRRVGVPIIARASGPSGAGSPGRVLGEVVGALARELPLRGVRWSLTPYHCLDMSASDPTRVLVRQVFEFAASHRLHVASLTPEENHRLFGKCNSPNGHGHNYRVEPCVEVGPDSAFTLREFERVVDEVIIQRFDHTHLNLDTREFGEGTGVNPTVENIARVAFDLLSPAVARCPGSPRLRHVTVWETDRTSAIYPA